MMLNLSYTKTNLLEKTNLMHANRHKKRTAAQSNLQITILPDIVQDAVQILFNVSPTSSMRPSTHSLQPIQSLHFRDSSRLS